MLNKTLANAILSVMSGGKKEPFYTIEIKFLTTDNSFTYTPLVIDGLILSQNFAYGYGDEIKVSIPMAPSDYSKLYAAYNKLTAQLTIRALDQNGAKVTGAPVLLKKFIPVFDSFKDPNKAMTDTSSRITPTGNSILVTLVEPELYKIRLSPIQAIYQNTTMAGVMSHIAEGYGISKTYIQVPDNAHKYAQIIIPPYKVFSDVFHTLQERYGVYMSGFNNYFTNSELYIWPIFDNNPKAPYFVKILQADDGAYAGAPFFHVEETGGVSIVINNSPNAQDHSLISAEHKGTSAQFLRAAVQADDVINQDPNGLLTYSADSVINVGLTNSRLAREGSNHTRYVHQTDNVYAIASELARDNYLSMILNWPQARPWLIRPGSAVRYYSDENGKIGKRTGLVSKALYIFARGDRGPNLTYTCKGTLDVRLDPNEQLTTTVS